MKALITGGAGFIGSHLMEYLMDQQWKVIVLDDFSTGRWKNLEYRSAFVNIVDGSVTDSNLVLDLVDQVDYVFHLAAVVGVKKAFEDPVNTLHVNIEGTNNVLRACASEGKRVLIASSSEAYGYGGEDLKEVDDCNIGSPMRSLRWAYGASKLVDEFIALSLHKQFRLPVTVVRPFNVVGPRQVGEYGMVLPRFIDWALKGEPIQVYGDGFQTRTFAYVGEVVAAFYDLMGTPESIGQVVNVAGNREISMLDLARKVKKITGSQSRIEFVSYEEIYGKKFDDSMKRVADTELLRSLIGWTPNMSLEEIIMKTIKWWEERRLS